VTTPAADDLRDTQHKIVDAAVRCFERYGPQRTSMSDIAEEAGISRRTLYDGASLRWARPSGLG
jgi:AcrR family transcriptional regulator